MTGINFDLLTVILLVLLAFTWGWSGGRSMGQAEVRNNVNKTIENMSKMFQSEAEKQKAEAEQRAKAGGEIWKLLTNPDGSTRRFSEIWQDVRKEAEKAKEKQNDGNRPDKPET